MKTINNIKLTDEQLRQIVAGDGRQRRQGALVDARFVCWPT
jgi:hypothetical protein